MDLNNLIQGLISDKGSDIASSVCAQIGISPETAQSFVPAALAQFQQVLSGGQLDISSLLGGGGISQLVDQADTAGLASQFNIDESQATEGLQAIAPKFLEAIQAEGADGLLGAVTGAVSEGGGGGLLSKLGGLFKR